MRGGTCFFFIFNRPGHSPNHLPTPPLFPRSAILASFDDLDAGLTAADLLPRSVTTGAFPAAAPAAAPPPPAATAASPSPPPSRSGARRPKRTAAATRKPYSPSVWTSSDGGGDASTTPSPSPSPLAAALAASRRTPKVAVPPSQAVAIAAAAATAALEGAPPPSLGPLKLGKRKAVDLDAIDDASERRRQRRLAKNRATAAVSRERKHAQMQALATTVYELQREVAALSAAVAERDAEIRRLKGG